MPQLRKTVFSLGGPERIADPADDVMLELGRQALMRQQQQASLAMEQQRLALARQQAGLAADGQERELARAAAEQAGYVLDPTTGEVATDPDTGAALRTMAARDLEARIGQAASRDAMERARFDREGADSDFSRRMAERGLEERGIDRAQAMAIARMQDETADKRMETAAARARQDSLDQWNRQIEHEKFLLRRDDEKDKDRQGAEARKIEHAQTEEAQKIAGVMSEDIRRGFVGQDLGDAPDVGGGPGRANWAMGQFFGGDPSLAAALGESEAVRAAREQFAQAYSAGDGMAVTRPEEINRIEQANSAVIDAYIREAVEREKAETYPDVGAWLVYAEALKRANSDAANTARQRVGVAQVQQQRLSPEEWDRQNALVIGRAAAPKAPPSPGPLGLNWSPLPSGQADPLVQLARALGLGGK
jgi:hypothetical protein